MGQKSNISWTDATWNPVTGCDRVSPGCDNCYALTLAKRLKAMGNPRYQRDGVGDRSGPGFGLTVHEDLLDLPRRWKKPRRVFVNSMSDLFNEDVPIPFIERVFDTMHYAPQHQFQCLTKRARWMQSVLAGGWPISPCDGPLADHRAEPSPNVWLGVSVENQQWADTRIPWLLKTPAAVRFLSVEPMIGPVDLSPWLGKRSAIDWVICGGESGPNRRDMDPDWARSIRDQCVAAGVAFFFKQGSGPRPGMHRELDGRTWEEYPEGSET